MNIIANLDSFAKALLMNPRHLWLSLPNFIANVWNFRFQYYSFFPRNGTTTISFYHL